MKWCSKFIGKTLQHQNHLHWQTQTEASHEATFWHGRFDEWIGDQWGLPINWALRGFNFAYENLFFRIPYPRPWISSRFPCDTLPSRIPEVSLAPGVDTSTYSRFTIQFRVAFFRTWSVLIFARNQCVDKSHPIFTFRKFYSRGIFFLQKISLNRE